MIQLLTNSTFQRIILVLSIIIILLMWRNSAEELKLERIVTEQNIKAIRDSSESYIDSLDGLITAERLAFIGDLEGLQEYNQELYDKIKKFEKKPNVSILYGSTTDIKVNGFTGKSTNTNLIKLNDSTYKLAWLFENAGKGWSKKIGGHSNFDVSILKNELDIIAKNTTIEIDSLSFTVDTYFVQNPDKSFSALAKSSYPGMILKTSGVLYPEKIIEKIPIMPEKNRISWGLQTGVGLNPLQISGGNGATVMLYVGLGIQYEFGNILKW